jgi:isorenieratene synthase
VISADGSILHADHVVIATDSPAADAIIKNSFPDQHASLTFPHGLANAIIRLWFDRSPKPTPEGGMFTGDFVMHNFFWLERMYKPYRDWHRATNGSAIEFHIYGPAETLSKPDAVLLAQAITEFYKAYPELRGHLIYQHLQRNPATHTLPSLGARGTHLGVETPWENLFCAGDWVRDPLPSFFLERACATGIKSANAILRSRGLTEWSLVEYLPPEPFVGWIEKLMKDGRRKRNNKQQTTNRT